MAMGKTEDFFVEKCKDETVSADAKTLWRRRVMQIYILNFNRKSAVALRIRERSVDIPVRFSWHKGLIANILGRTGLSTLL